MKLKTITHYLESIAPLRFQETYDNAGTIIGNAEEEIAGAIIALDCTPQIIDEAIAMNCNLVITHHPLIFKGIKKFNEENQFERALIKAIKNDIAVYAIHTNLDNVLRNGVNEKIAGIIGLKKIDLLLTKECDSIEPDYEVGSGVTGLLEPSMGEMDFLHYIKERMHCKMIRYTAPLGHPVKKVAVCGGAGHFLLEAAIQSHAGIFISADFKYHDFFNANKKIMIVDVGHYESEYYTIELIFGLIKKKFPKFVAHCTKVITNPVLYY